jgi:hypothetical protein
LPQPTHTLLLPRSTHRRLETEASAHKWLDFRTSTTARYASRYCLVSFTQLLDGEWWKTQHQATPPAKLRSPVIAFTRCINLFGCPIRSNTHWCRNLLLIAHTLNPGHCKVAKLVERPVVRDVLYLPVPRSADLDPLGHSKTCSTPTGCPPYYRQRRFIIPASTHLALPLLPPPTVMSALINLL